ncbi:DNA repair protein RadC [Polaribacter sp.]|uniref:RadC family protein n=1 Tax=Polaribacter sp. TaxID=1920175 RepID=UPI0025F34AD2|nr:DNA repair protein RadC [Polaribacter sp.]
MKKLTIKSWAKGKTTLSDAELIAILIGSGNRQESAVALSKRILQTVDGNINELAKLSVEKLSTFKGIGEAKAISIITALELGKRRQLETALEKPKITSSKAVFDLMQPIIGDLEHEEFWVLFLNNSNKVLAKSQMSKGGLTATIVDVRLLFKRALELASVGMIVCHNHPSGKLEPSQADKQLTEKIRLAGSTLDIKLLDHLIITEKWYFSFADEGVL